MYSFGVSSRAKLDTCVGNLQEVAEIAIQRVDFSVICGHRDEDTQNAHFQAKVSKVRWPDSKHNKSPSQAFDIAPYHQSWGMLMGGKAQLASIAAREGKTPAQIERYIMYSYYFMAGVVMASARERDIELRWGGDWDGDNDYSDNPFNDLGHFEILKPRTTLWRL